MPSVVAAPDVSREAHAAVERLDAAILSARERLAALDRFASLPSGREKPSRYWRIDLESLSPDFAGFDPAATSVRIVNPHARAVVCDLSTAAREHAALLARAFGTTRLRETKFGALATALAQSGAFVYLPADVACDDPIVVEYTVAGRLASGYTVVLAERGARAAIVERVSGTAALACHAAEIVGEENADVTYATVQELSDETQCVSARAARPGRDGRLSWAVAELGAALSVADLGVTFAHPGAQAHLTSLFFPRGSQHVDVASTVAHDAGEATSNTLVKSAATERGQARYLGNIAIAPHAQGSNASLRDDALLLSDKAHIDSIPALEIAANDVKAYHGATVGAIDADQIFYMESRGIERNAAERMIALGFFEPAIDRFPTESLRNELRAALAVKLS